MANGQQQIVRVYLCAAYRDMQAERAYLHAQVFPQASGLFAQRGFRLEIVDPCLRRSEEQAEGPDGLELGLDVIENCRPFFLGFVGTRDNQVIDHVPLAIGRKYPGLRDYSRCSRLQLEAIHGVLREPADAWGSFFYFRSGNFLKTLPDEERAHWLPADRMEGHRLGAFKKAIRSTRRPVRDYDCEFNPTTKSLTISTGLGAAVLADMQSLLGELARRPLPVPRPIVWARPAPKPAAPAPIPEAQKPMRPVLPRGQQPGSGPPAKAPVRAAAPSNLLNKPNAKAPAAPRSSETTKPPTMHSIRLPDLPGSMMPRAPVPTMSELALPDDDVPNLPLPPEPKPAAPASRSIAAAKPVVPAQARPATTPLRVETPPSAQASPVPAPRAEPQPAAPAARSTPPAATPPAAAAPPPVAARAVQPVAPAQPRIEQSPPKPVAPPAMSTPSAPLPPRVEQKPVAPAPTAPRVEQKPITPPAREEQKPVALPPARVEPPSVPVPPTPPVRAEQKPTAPPAAPAARMEQKPSVPSAPPARAEQPVTSPARVEQRPVAPPVPPAPARVEQRPDTPPVAPAAPAARVEQKPAAPSVAPVTPISPAPMQVRVEQRPAAAPVAPVLPVTPTPTPVRVEQKPAAAPVAPVTPVPPAPTPVRVEQKPVEPKPVTPSVVLPVPVVPAAAARAPQAPVIAKTENKPAVAPSTLPPVPQPSVTPPPAGPAKVVARPVLPQQPVVPAAPVAPARVDVQPTTTPPRGVPAQPAAKPAAAEPKTPAAPVSKPSTPPTVPVPGLAAQAQPAVGTPPAAPAPSQPPALAAQAKPTVGTPLAVPATSQPPVLGRPAAAPLVPTPAQFKPPAAPEQPPVLAAQGRPPVVTPPARTPTPTMPSFRVTDQTNATPIARVPTPTMPSFSVTPPKPSAPDLSPPLEANRPTVRDDQGLTVADLRSREVALGKGPAEKTPADHRPPAITPTLPATTPVARAIPAPPPAQPPAASKPAATPLVPDGLTLPPAPKPDGTRPAAAPLVPGESAHGLNKLTPAPGPAVPPLVPDESKPPAPPPATGPAVRPLAAEGTHTPFGKTKDNETIKPAATPPQRTDSRPRGPRIEDTPPPPPRPKTLNLDDIRWPNTPPPHLIPNRPNWKEGGRPTDEAAEEFVDFDGPYRGPRIDFGDESRIARGGPDPESIIDLSEFESEGESRIARYSGIPTMPGDEPLFGESLPEAKQPPAFTPTSDVIYGDIDPNADPSSAHLSHLEMEDVPRFNNDEAEQGASFGNSAPADEAEHSFARFGNVEPADVPRFAEPPADEEPILAEAADDEDIPFASEDVPYAEEDVPYTGAETESEIVELATPPDSFENAENRRTHQRLASDLDCVCETIGRLEMRWTAKLRDVSRGGLMIVTERRFESGTVLSIKVPGLGDYVPTLLVRVVRVTSEEDGLWALGCRFARELGDRDVAALSGGA